MAWGRGGLGRRLRGVGIVAGARHERSAELVAGALLVTAMLFGGGPRGLGDAVVMLFALPVVFTVCVRDSCSWRRLSSPQRIFGLLLAAVAAWQLLQLIPLPPGWFAALPMRREILSDLSEASIAPGWLPATLDYWGSVRSLHALIVFGASWFLLSFLHAISRERLLRLCVVLGCAMALLGYAQAAGGRYSVLRPYAFHHSVGALGLFANRNHFACLTAMLIPAAVAFAVKARRGNKAIEALHWSAAAFMLLLASALTFSRTGVLLTMLSTTAAIALMVRRGRELRVAAAVIATAAGAAAIYAWHGINSRLKQDPLDDLRWQYLRNGWTTAKAYFPWGSGPGTFHAVYAPFEPVSQMGNVFALHAHNELLEMLVESGLFAVLALPLFIFVLRFSLRKELIVATDDASVRWASAIAVAAPMLHSLVDYPLRTYAVAMLFALAMANVTERFVVDSKSD